MSALARFGSAFVAGGLFGGGLAIAGMTKPSKVVAFLDVFGAWDPSLAFVMLGAIGIHLVAFRLVTRRPSPLFDRHFHLPTRSDLDLRLVAGSAIFGIGWALAGFCPGPGLVSAASGSLPALAFVGAMTAGMMIEHVLARALAERSPSDPRRGRADAQPRRAPPAR